MPADGEHPGDGPAYTGPPPLTLLGPQRNPRVDAVLTSMGLFGARVALVNAGWQERESDDWLLVEQAGGNTVNLRLWQRMQLVWDADPEFARADRDRRAQLEESQEMYLVGLEHCVLALRALLDRPARTAWLHERAVRDAEDVLRGLDRTHMARVEEIYQEFWRHWPPHERRAVAEQRDHLAGELAGADALVVAGGHVGVLLGALHLFNLAPLLRMPVIAWGAGAMAMTDEVVLFHDHAAQGPAMPEVFSGGLGRVHGVVALPSARERLDLANQRRMGILGRRFAPSQCLLLDEGAQVAIAPDGRLPAGAPVLGADGIPVVYVPPVVVPEVLPAHEDAVPEDAEPEDAALDEGAEQPEDLLATEAVNQ